MNKINKYKATGMKLGHLNKKTASSQNLRTTKLNELLQRDYCKLAFTVATIRNHCKNSWSHINYET